MRSGGWENPRKQADFPLKNCVWLLQINWPPKTLKEVLWPLAWSPKKSLDGRECRAQGASWGDTYLAAWVLLFLHFLLLCLNVRDWYCLWERSRSEKILQKEYNQCPL
jgi:hypothetical protein